MPKAKLLTIPSFGLLVQIAFWIVLFGFIISLSSMVLGWEDGLYRSLLTMCCHLINFYFFYSYLVPRFEQKGRYSYLFLGLLILLAILTPFRAWMENTFFMNPSAIHAIGAKAGIGLILFSEVTLAAFATLLRLAENREHLKLQMKELEKNKLETELRFLKGQMSPHFLFNSINNIYSLVLVKSDLAPGALMKLSSLLRYLLYECDQKVSVAKELEALMTYRDLFQLKFEEPLKLTWDIRIENLNHHVEPLTLVPLLENAMKHSGLGTDPLAEVRFAIRSDRQKLIVETENSISQWFIPDEKGGIGLTNIQRRLEKTFPNDHRLEIRQSEERFSLYLEMPLL